MNDLNSRDSLLLWLSVNFVIILWCSWCMLRLVVLIMVLVVWCSGVVSLCLWVIVLGSDRLSWFSGWWCWVLV